MSARPLPRPVPSVVGRVVWLIINVSAYVCSGFLAGHPVHRLLHISKHPHSHSSNPPVLLKKKKEKKETNPKTARLAGRHAGEAGQWSRHKVLLGWQVRPQLQRPSSKVCGQAGPETSLARTPARRSRPATHWRPITAACRPRAGGSCCWSTPYAQGWRCQVCLLASPCC